jgi:hypothetical protein
VKRTAWKSVHPHPAFKESQMVLLALLGALIGMAAASIRNFSLWWGLLGGVVLGPLAVLLFFAKGTERRPCPYCREPVRADATVCKHCHGSLSAFTKSA